MIGRTLSHYSIEEKIGAGGMGEVYRARDEHLDRDVAIKVLPTGTLADEHARNRFRKEALALSKLNHPSIATVFDFDTQEGVDFIVMELVEGASLAEKVKTGPLPEKEVSELGVQIAEALDEAHERGIVHRDLKPGNIAVTTKGRVKVLDFGLVRMLRPLDDEATTEAMTEELSVAGTLPYMSPEELKGERGDHRSDLYSFGVVLYEMATGKRPFEEKLSTALTAAIVQKPPAPPSAHNRKVSPGLESTILKALDKDPDNRYQSVREMRVDLVRLSTPVSVVAHKRKPIRSRRWLWAAAGVVAVMAILFALNARGVRDRLLGPSGPRIESIAVLPLENLSGDPEQEYFADGMTEELIAELSKIRALRVISRQSVMQFKDSDMPLPDIAEALNVAALVQGSVRRSGQRIRVTTQLVQASPEQHLWAESYERDMQNVLALQSEVAQAIVNEIRIAITPEEKARLSRARPVDPEAHEAYLRGNYFSNKRTVDGWRRAIEYYEQAIERDSQYAPAYAALAHTLAALPNYSPVPPEDFYPKARESAQKAIEMDDTLATAHIALARVLYRYYWEWELAEGEIQQAIKLEPGTAEAQLHYGHSCVWKGQSNEGIAAGTYAVELDPLSLPTNTEVGWLFYNARRFDMAIEQQKKVLDMEPNYIDAHLCLFFTYVKKEQYDNALASLQKTHDLGHFSRPISQNPFYAYLHALWGKREEALRAIRVPEWTAGRPWSRAIAHGALGDKDEAFRLLDQAYERRAPMLVLARIDPRLDSLRDDPRFHDFLRRMKFPE